MRLLVDEAANAEPSAVRREHLNAVKAADKYLHDNFQHPSPRLDAEQMSSFSKQQSPRYVRPIAVPSNSIEGDYNRPRSSMRPDEELDQSVAASSTHEEMYDSDSFYDSRPPSSRGDALVVAKSRPPSGADRREHMNAVKAADNYLHDNFQHPSPRFNAEQLSSFSKQQSPRYSD